MASHQKKRSILILCPIYAPYAGGGGQYFPLLVENISSLGVFTETVVVTEFHTKHAFIEKKENLTILRILPRRDSLENKSLTYSVFSFICTYLFIILIIPFLILYYRVSVFQFTRYYYRPIFILCSFLSNVFKTITIMDIRTNVEKDSIFRNAFGVDVFLSMSNNIKRQLKRANVDESKIVEIPNVIKFNDSVVEADDDQIIDKFLKGNEKRFLLFVGQLIERKSILEVLEAFKSFRYREKSHFLVLIGRDMLDLESQGLLKISDGVIFLGEQPREVVLAFIRKSTMVLQPSKIEGVSRVSLEALRYGKKVLLPNCVDEFVTSNPAFVTETNSAEDIYRKILEIMNSDKHPVYNVDVHSPAIHTKHLSKLYGNVLSD